MSPVRPRGANPASSPGSTGEQRKVRISNAGRQTGDENPGRSTARQVLGRQAEAIACEFLERQGLEVVARNYRRRLGELDLVLRDGGTLVIAEVRTRARDDYGGAAASVDGWKRRRLVRAAQQLLQQRRDLASLPARFDVVVVREARGCAPAVEWIRHAFETDG